MLLTVLVESGLLVISLAANAFLLLRSKPAKNRAQSIELQEFLADLMGGGIGMIAVARVDPNSLIMRSPRSTR